MTASMLRQFARPLIDLRTKITSIIPFLCVWQHMRPQVYLGHEQSTAFGALMIAFTCVRLHMLLPSFQIERAMANIAREFHAAKMPCHMTISHRLLQAFVAAYLALIRLHIGLFAMPAHMLAQLEFTQKLFRTQFARSNLRFRMGWLCRCMHRVDVMTQQFSRCKTLATPIAGHRFIGVSAQFHMTSIGRFLLKLNRTSAAFEHKAPVQTQMVAASRNWFEFIMTLVAFVRLIHIIPCRVAGVRLHVLLKCCLFGEVLIALLAVIIFVVLEIRLVVNFHHMFAHRRLTGKFHITNWAAVWLFQYVRGFVTFQAVRIVEWTIAYWTFHIMGVVL